jgi:hypothetical protein
VTELVTEETAAATTTSKPRVTVTVTKSVSTSVQRVIGKAIVQLLKNEYQKKNTEEGSSNDQVRMTNKYLTSSFLLYMPVFEALAGGKGALYHPLQAPAGGKVW